MANELWCHLAVAHNCVLFMYTNCLITYCSTALILFIVFFVFFFSFLQETYGWLWHEFPYLLKSLRSTIHLIIFSNDFGECIRHSAMLQLTLDVDVLLVLSLNIVPRGLILQHLKTPWGFAGMHFRFLSLFQNSLCVFFSILACGLQPKENQRLTSWPT